MTILITGVAGFIGMHCAKRLLEAGERIVGIDNLNEYYDVGLKQARLEQLKVHRHFYFVKADITDREAMRAIFAHQITRVLHLAAQAGVRHSLTHPFAYVDSNVTGHLSMLEACRQCDSLEHLVYASSSSVYGGNTKLPFAAADRVDDPISLYAATKKAGELMSVCYSHLFKIPQTGLRFFTVYGPWGRPDMAAFIFTKALFENRPISLFNYGKMRRDFTYIDDIVSGVIRALERPPAASAAPRHRIYNLGNSRSERLSDFVSILETATDRRAQIKLEPIQLGDVAETYADIEDSRRDLDFNPITTIGEGLPRFVAWYRQFFGI